MTPLAYIWHECSSVERLVLLVGMVSKGRANWKVTG